MSCERDRTSNISEPCLSRTCIWARDPRRPPLCSSSCAKSMPRRSTSSATSSTSGRCAADRTGRSRTTTCCRSCCGRARKGARVVFIPGNHDEALRDYCGLHFGGVEIQRDAVHTTADGRRYLVLHGDEFDIVVRYASWLAFLGDRVLRARAVVERAAQLGAPAVGARLLVALGLPQVTREDRRELHRRVRGSAGCRGRPARRRRRHLRPYPPRRQTGTSAICTT